MPLRLLVVDDSPANRLQLAGLLQDFGLKVSLAADRAEAARLANQTQFDLVLMDLAMPELDGVAATREIRESEANDSTRRAAPIAAYTTLDVAQDAQLLTSVGLSDVVAKAASSDSLASCIQRWCSQAVRAR